MDMETDEQNSGKVISAMVRVQLALHGRLQNDLVDVLGVHKTSVSARMNRGTWTIQDLDAMSRFFDVPVATFFQDPSGMFEQGKWISPCIPESAELADVTVR